MRILSATTKELIVSQVVDDVGCTNLNGKPDDADLKSIISTNNAYLVLTCIELGDGHAEVREIASRIEQQWVKVKAQYNKIVIVPFAHLSEMPQSKIENVEELITKLFRSLKNKGVPVMYISPNQGDCLFTKLLVFDNGTSVRYSSSPNGLNRILNDILSIYGSEQVLKSLSKLLTQRR